MPNLEIDEKTARLLKKYKIDLSEAVKFFDEKHSSPSVPPKTVQPSSQQRNG